MFNKLIIGLVGILSFGLLVFTMMGRNHKEAKALLEARKLRREKELAEIALKASEKETALQDEKEKHLNQVNEKIKEHEEIIKKLEIDTDEIIEAHENKIKAISGNQSMTKRLSWLKNSKYTPKRFDEQKGETDD